MYVFNFYQMQVLHIQSFFEEGAVPYIWQSMLKVQNKKKNTSQALKSVHYKSKSMESPWTRLMKPTSSVEYVRGVAQNRTRASTMR